MIEQALDDHLSDNDEEESFFQDVDILQKHGINVADIKKLKAAGICTIKGIQMSTKKKLCNIKGFSDTKVEKIKEACQKIATLGFMTALEVSDRRKQVFKISTGSSELDEDVDFCGYTVPHPAENKMHFRIQSKETPALEILKRGFQDLEKVCEHTIDVFEKEVKEFNKM